MPDRLKWNGHRFIYVHASEEELKVSMVGQRIRDIANEIEQLDPSYAPFFMGFEVVGTRRRGLFQHGVIVGEDASLQHAERMLERVRREKDSKS